MHRRRLSLLILVLLAMVGAACGDDDGILTGDPGSQPTSTTAVSTTSRSPATTTTVAPTTTRVPGKVGDHPPTPSDGVPVSGPRPSTTPNVAQPADSLHDGEHVAFMVDVDVAGRQVDIDVIQWIRKPDFETAIADGRLSADDPCVELDYCIANAQDRVRVMPVAADARVSVVDWDSCCESRRTDDLADVFERMREGRDLYVLTVAGGAIVALDELYTP